jgi:hypothetical protein
MYNGSLHGARMGSITFMIAALPVNHVIAGEQRDIPSISATSEISSISVEKHEIEL